MSLIIAGAKAEINASLALGRTASVTYGAGPWVVPSGVHEGALRAGAERDSFHVAVRRLQRRLPMGRVAEPDRLTSRGMPRTSGTPHRDAANAPPRRWDCHRGLARRHRHGRLERVYVEWIVRYRRSHVRAFSPSEPYAHAHRESTRKRQAIDRLTCSAGPHNSILELWDIAPESSRHRSGDIRACCLRPHSQEGHRPVVLRGRGQGAGQRRNGTALLGLGGCSSYAVYGAGPVAARWSDRVLTLTVSAATRWRIAVYLS